MGLVWAFLLAAAAGAVVALLTARLRGLYLALATFAFATAMDTVFFNNRLGEGGSLEVKRLHLPGIPTSSNTAYFMLSAVAFTLCSLGVLAIRRGRYGRQLTALNDSPAACATLGVNTNITKLVIFAASAGLAGLSGALFGGLRGQVSPNDFAALGSLVLLLTLRIGGVSTVTGALFGAFSYAIYQGYSPHLPHLLQNAYLLTGLAAISVGRDPNGFGGRVAQVAERLRPNRTESETPDVPPQATGPAAVFLEEEAGLVHVGS
jgi:branched-chain amino acid transport system permease protein